MSEHGPEPALVLTRAACAAKAALGPTAWAVLEELALGAERGSDGRLVVTTSVRRLGAVLGLDKDTVARSAGQAQCRRLRAPPCSRAAGERLVLRGGLDLRPHPGRC